MAREKLPTINGVFSSRYEIIGTRKDGTTYTIPHLVVEVDGSYTNSDGHWIEKKYLMDFSLGSNVMKVIDGYSPKDPIEITFAMKGGHYKKKSGEMGYDNAMVIVGLKHADIDYVPNPPKKLNENDIPQSFKAQPKVVVEEEPDDLPF